MAIEKELPRHSTDAEIKFIEKIGRHSESNLTRAELLRGYLAGCAKRTDWGAIDAALVVAFAQGCLGKLG